MVQSNGWMVNRSNRYGFTLLELLVTISIIAVLVALLSPQLAHARERSREAVCLSNAKQIGLGTRMYWAEHDVIPFFAVSGNSYCAWSAMGKMVSNEWNAPFWLPAHAQRRPLNPYIYNNLDPRDYKVADEARMEIPPFKCPSDTTSWQKTWRRDQQPRPVSTYDDVGSSYVWNMTGITRNYGFGGNKTRQYQQVFQIADIRWSSEFILFWEDSASMGIWSGVNREGDHGTFRHTLIFMDGHGAHLEMDTTKKKGDGWRATLD